MVLLNELRSVTSFSIIFSLLWKSLWGVYNNYLIFFKLTSSYFKLNFFMWKFFKLLIKPLVLSLFLLHVYIMSQFLYSLGYFFFISANFTNLDIILLEYHLWTFIILFILQYFMILVSMFTLLPLLTLVNYLSFFYFFPNKFRQKIVNFIDLFEVPSFGTVDYRYCFSIHHFLCFDLYQSFLLVSVP